MGCGDWKSYRPLKKPPQLDFHPTEGAIFGCLIVLLAEFLL